MLDTELSQIGDGWRSEWRRSKKKKALTGSFRRQWIKRSAVAFQFFLPRWFIPLQEAGHQTRRFFGSLAPTLDAISDLEAPKHDILQMDRLFFLNGEDDLRR